MSNKSLFKKLKKEKKHLDNSQLMRRKDGLRNIQYGEFTGSGTSICMHKHFFACCVYLCHCRFVFSGQVLENIYQTG